MAKFMNVVRTTVKEDCRDEFVEQHSERLEAVSYTHLTLPTSDLV